MFDWFNGKVEDFEQKHIIDPGNNFLKNKVATTLADLGSDIWTWFVGALPDIAGYGVVATGAFMMVAPIADRGGMLKPLGILSAGLILTVCILTTN